MNEALKLMLTGMSTVFFILIMVVVLGRLIIQITNRFWAVPSKVSAVQTSTVAEIEANKLAAIVSAVEITTRGKGKITSVEKL
ncbi:OadG family protein [uncultured Draconibacterium sp.]|uniref:OadG family protein n=1 Tax=uncultured Draconibacterium sp. TaxID=1573823 RepID=UPI0025E5209E|nr:OadG family protein [uncultured Draconibacterium sp.]